MKISVKQVGSTSDILVYESNITPMIGDCYSSNNFADFEERVIKQRQLIPNAPNSIIIYVDYAYPESVKRRKEEALHEAHAGALNDIIS